MQVATRTLLATSSRASASQCRHHCGLPLRLAFLHRGSPMESGTPHRPQEQAATGWASDCKAVRTETGTYQSGAGTFGRVESSQPSQIENGGQSGVDTIERIAKALGVSPGWLAYGVGPMVLPPRRRTRLHLQPHHLAAVSASDSFICIRGFPSRVLDDGENICRISRLSISPAHPALVVSELKPIVRRYTDDKSSVVSRRKLVEVRNRNDRN